MSPVSAGYSCPAPRSRPAGRRLDETVAEMITALRGYADDWSDLSRPLVARGADTGESTTGAAGGTVTEFEWVEFSRVAVRRCF